MLTVEIETGNAALHNEEGGTDLLEVRRLLQVAAEKLVMGHTEGKLLDSNGNTTGFYRLQP